MKVRRNALAGLAAAGALSLALGTGGSANAASSHFTVADPGYVAVAGDVSFTSDGGISITNIYGSDYAADGYGPYLEILVYNNTNRISPDYYYTGCSVGAGGTCKIPNFSTKTAKGKPIREVMVAAGRGKSGALSPYGAGPGCFIRPAGIYDGTCGG